MAIKNGRDLLVTELKGISRERGSNLTKKQIEEVLIMLKEGVVATFLNAEGEITIDFPGLLSVKKKFIEATERTNPATREKFMDRDKYTLKITASTSIKNRIKSDAEVK
ncbi:MAG: HU family DNA-binding protein [Fusobacteriaceae bacterium]